MNIKEIRDKFLQSIKKENLGLLLILIFTAAYFAFRPVITAALVGTFTIIYIFEVVLSIFPKTNYSKFVPKTKYIIYGCVLLYLGLSIFNFRNESTDGLNFSYRIAYYIKENSHLVFLDAAPKPFLFEMLMGLIWRVTNLNLLSFIMGCLGVAAIYTTYLLIKVYKPSADLNSRIKYLLLVCCNPLFITLMLFQFKPDLLAYTLSNLSFILYIKFVKTKKLKFLYILAIILGLILVTKILYIIYIGPMLIAVFVFMLRSFKPATIVKNSLISLFIIAIPLCIWLSIFGATIPKFESFLSYKGIVESNALELEYDKTIYEQCNQERVINDYSSIFEAPKNRLFVIFQPIFYVQQGMDSALYMFSLGEAGPFMYLAIIIFIIVNFNIGILKKSYLESSLKMILLSAIIIFYIQVAHVLWYILFAFPFLAIAFRDFVNTSKDPLLVKPFLRQILKKYVYLYIALAVLFLVLETSKFVWDTGDNSRTFRRDEVYNSAVIEKYSSEGIIFDASVHPYGVNYPLVSNSYSRIYTSPYFFASTELSNSEIKQYLLSKDIKYIIAIKRRLFRKGFYTGCILKNNQKLFEFLNENTELVKDKKVNYLYKIKD